MNATPHLMALVIGTLVAAPMSRAADSLNVRTLGVWDYGPCRATTGMRIGGHRYAVFSSGERLAVLNIDDPSRPRFAGDLALDGEIARVWTGGGQAAVAVDGAGLVLVDLSDPFHPVRRGTLAMAAPVTGVSWFGTHLACAAGSTGLVIADIGDPASPRVTGSCQWPSPAMDVDVAGTTAYVAAGTAGLRAVDITDPSAPTEIGHCGLEGSATGIEVRNRHAYLSCGTGGIAAVNIDTLAISVHCPVNRMPTQLVLHGDFVVASDTAAGIRVVETQSLADVGQAAYFRLPYTASQLSLLDSLALVADSLAGLRILDLGALYHRWVDNVWKGTDTAYAVLPSPDGLLAYLAAGLDGLMIFTVNGQAGPVEQGRFQPGGRVYQLSQPVSYLSGPAWPDSDKQYCIAAGDSGLVLVDLAQSLELARERTAAPARDVSMSFYRRLLPDTVVVGSDSIYMDTVRLAAVARGDSNVWFYGITDSSITPWGPVPRDHPVHRVLATGRDFCCSGGQVLADYCGIGAWDSVLQFRTRLTIPTGGWVGPHATMRREMAPVGDSLVFFDSYWGRGRTVTLPAAAGGGDVGMETVAACAVSHGLQLFSLNDIGISHWATPGQCRGVALMDGYALVADGSAGLQRASMAVPDTIVEIYSQRMALSANALAVSGDRTYLATADSGLWTLDWTDSARPRTASFTKLPQTAFGLTVHDSLLLAADGAAGLLVLSLADPDAPAVIGALALPGFAMAVRACGSLAWVAADSRGLMAVDIADPSAPMLIGSYDSPGTAFGLAVDTAASRAYLADGLAGVQVIDVSDPSAPALLGGYDTPGCAFDVGLSSGRIVAADGGYGLVVLDAVDPAHPGPVGTLDSDGFARALSVRDSIVFLADGPGGLSVINIADPTMPVEVGRYRPGRQVWSAVPSGDRLFTLDGASSVRLLRPERLARQPAAPAGGVLRFENRPNPFRDRTVIQFRLASGQATALSVYNIQGQLVRTLAAGVFPAGDHRVPWDGRSTRGHPLASGVYLCRLHTGDRDLCHTIVLLR